MPYLRTEAAAEYSGISVSTLTKLRVVGTGPAFIKAGRTVLYDTADLDRWLADRRCLSTSEARKVA